jgi:hypothetical protein
MRVITYPQPNGQVAVIIPSPNAVKGVDVFVEVPALDEEGNPTDETATVIHQEEVPMSIEEIAAKDVPAGLPYKIVDSLDIDNDYFNAYDYSEEAGAEVNIDKAKDLHLDKFRAARTPLLAKLDIDYMRALEVEDSVKASAIAVAKQELRDVTKITLPDTLPEIKEVWPTILN